MNTFSKISAVLAVAFTMLLTGCASTSPVAYSNLNSAAKLQPNMQKDTDKIPYVYTSLVNWNHYSGVIFEPVVIYSGADQQFGSMSDTDKQELANYMDTAFRKALSRRFKFASKPEDHVIRLRVTLAGASTNTILASTITRMDLAGMPYNVVQSARGKEGILMGSVSYSVEVYDALNNQLLKAYVTKQYPNAMNIVATVGALTAAKTGIDKGADDLLAQLK